MSSHTQNRSYRVRAWVNRFGPLLVLLATGATPQSQAAQVGTPWTGERGVQESTQSIMARDKAESHHAKRPKVKPRLRADFQNLPLNPDSPRIDSWPAPGVPLAADASTNSAQTPVLGFTAATLADTQAFPPDSMGAVGPSQF